MSWWESQAVSCANHEAEPAEGARTEREAARYAAERTIAAPMSRLSRSRLVFNPFRGGGEEGEVISAHIPPPLMGKRRRSQCKATTEPHKSEKSQCPFNPAAAAACYFLEAADVRLAKVKDHPGIGAPDVMFPCERRHVENTHATKRCRKNKTCGL